MNKQVRELTVLKAVAFMNELRNNLNTDHKNISPTSIASKHKCNPGYFSWAVSAKLISLKEDGYYKPNYILFSREQAINMIRNINEMNRIKVKQKSVKIEFATDDDLINEVISRGLDKPFNISSATDEDLINEVIVREIDPRFIRLMPNDEFYDELERRGIYTVSQQEMKFERLSDEELSKLLKSRGFSGSLKKETVMSI